MSAIVSRGRVSKRTWTHGGKRRSAWQFTFKRDGVQVRRQGFLSRAESQEALDAAREQALHPEAPAAAAITTLTLAEAVTRYLAAKARKRSLAEDERICRHIKAELGADTPLAELTAARIAAYKAARLAARGGRLSAAAVNRPLALLRHLLRLACEEWGALATVPVIRLEREPQGRIRWLEPDEEHRLLEACRGSQNPHLTGIVTVALESGLRKGELLGLTWDRVDLSTGVLRLEVTKSGRRRVVPMRQAVYDTLAAFPEPREGRVWPRGDIRTAFERAVRDAKLEDFTLHSCRHHFASWFIMRGGNIVALQEVLGHASLAMTRRYAHLSPDHLRAEVAKTERPAAEAQGERNVVDSTAERAVSPRNAGVAQWQSN